MPGIVIALTGLQDDQPIEAQMLGAGIENLPEGGAVLIRTDWDRYWKTKRYEMHPYLTAGATQVLKSAGITLLGIDALNVDSTVQGTSHVHAGLLAEDILIVENLRGLGQLVSQSFLLLGWRPFSHRAFCLCSLATSPMLEASPSSW